LPAAHASPLRSAQEIRCHRRGPGGVARVGAAAGGGGSSILPQRAQPPFIQQPAAPLPVSGAPGAVIQPTPSPGAEAALAVDTTTKVGDGETAVFKETVSSFTNDAPEVKIDKVQVSEPPPIIAAHFDLDQLLADADAIEAHLRQQREAEAIALILAISEAIT
jgi:hypothetical protein